ncbi:nucleoprotein TPR/MLP1 [Artemisia annua]|uniref:Nucleoprotein TPR/MLP1 n=1 Tax=Artemisia annua TaxID=35608 RepID=A0A2U1KP31_ARTAN|nr:nucleoprotein TPR/MLP1 [Artemisia annua]
MLQMIAHKDVVINEKSSSIKEYLDKIDALIDAASSKDSLVGELEASLSREKALVERVNDELTLKDNNLIELKKVHGEREADISSKVRKLKEEYKDTSRLLKRKDDKFRKLESKLEALHNKLCSCKEMAAANEERLSDELSTIHKIVEVSEEVIECLLKGDELLAVSAKLTRSHANAVTCLTKQLKKVESTNNELVKQFGIVL